MPKNKDKSVSASAADAARWPSDPKSSPKKNEVAGSDLSQAAPKKGKPGKKAKKAKKAKK
jgi:hypothetical protein